MPGCERDLGGGGITIDHLLQDYEVGICIIGLPASVLRICDVVAEIQQAEVTTSAW